MTDGRGKTLVVGDRVVYPGRSGSSLWMNEGVVADLGNSAFKTDCVYVKKDYGDRCYWVSKFNLVLVDRVA
jgi:hypothetical protein